MNAMRALAATDVENYTVGDVIDRRYELRRDLGRGGCAVVFEARHVFTGRSVALKIVSPDAAREDKAELRARLMREAQALAAVRHPGVVDILDGGVAENGSPYIVMERLMGRTLEGLTAARGKIALSDTVGLALQLCGALGAAHDVGVVHRDVKPGNVIIIRDVDGYERVKLVDFGIAQLRHQPSPKLTGIGAVIGTPAYMSPEQLLALDDIDNTADVYSLGLVMFECLSGRVPYPGNYAQVLLRAVSEEPAPSLRAAAPEVPEALAQVVDRAIAKSRSARFASIQEFSLAIRTAMPNAQARTTLLGPPPLPTGDSKTSRARGVPVAQRRRTPRAPYITPVRLLLEEGVLDGRTEDISEGGTFVLAETTCAPDQLVKVRFALPMEGRVVTVEARVRWVRAAPGADSQGLHAIGLEFVNLTDEVRESIARYVALMGDPKQP
jgi:uncharacterized protein (TIGR02266 family)